LQIQKHDLRLECEIHSENVNSNLPEPKFIINGICKCLVHVGIDVTFCVYHPVEKYMYYKTILHSTKIIIIIITTPFLNS